MEASKLQLDIFQKALIGLGVAFLFLFGPTLFFMITGDDVAATFTGTLTAGLLLAITHVAAFAGGAWYTRGTMEMGADVALRAQETNDRWDERKTATITKSMIEGARIGRSSQPADQTLFPLPSQDPSWLPPITVLQSGDDDDGYNHR